MKTALFLATLLTTTTASAALEKSPMEKYSIKNRNYDAFSVEIKVVKNNKVRETCEKYSRDLGLGGFGYAMNACAFWYEIKGENKHCLVILPEMVNNDTLGHEFRHCFVGNFH